MSTRVTRSSSKRGSASLAPDATSSSSAPAASSAATEPSTPQKGKAKGKKVTKQDSKESPQPRSSLSTGSPSPRSGKRVKLAVSEDADSAMNGSEAEEKAVKQLTFAEFLKGRTVADVLSAGKNIVIVASNEPLVSAFQTLVSHHILSAPVWDPVKKQYLGFLDMRDLIRYVVEAVERRSIDQKALSHQHEDGCCGSASASSSESTEKKNPKKAGKAGKLAVVTDDSAASDDAEEQKAPLTPAAQHHHISAVLEHHSISVQDFIAKSKWAFVRPGDSLVSVLQQFSAGSHRVAVVNEQDKVVDVLSQSAVIKFIHNHRAELAQELAVPIDEIGLGSAPVLTVPETTSALDTFKVMAEKDRSGIAVVDSNGRFVGNTSGSDLKLFVRCPEHMMHIRQPVMDFLAQVRQADVKETPNSRSPTISVPHNIALERVIGKLVVTRIHRLFVADSDRGYKPERVISITDVLRFILSRV